MDPRAREPDPETIELLTKLSRTSREYAAVAADARRELEDAVRRAKSDGHSYSQIQKATGLSLGTVQRIVK